MAPKLASELIPETCAQVAVNVRLSSGDLNPYHKSSVTAALTKSGVIRTIFPMDDGVGGLKWLHWTEEVDVARAQIQNDNTQRIYYTGAGEPRVTNYDLATGGSGDYPQAYYTLGLPTPLTAPVAAAVGFTSMTSQSRARDSGNIVTIKVASTAPMKTGMYVTVTGLSGTNYNLTNAQITVTDATHFTYYCTGPAEAETTDTGGTVVIAGVTQTRTYVYTWYTAWGEESTPSPVSNTIYLKEGQQVEITSLPAAWPGSYTGVYQTTGMKLRIYRTVPSSSGTRYWKVGDVDLGTTTFTDNVDVYTLSTSLSTQDYDQPAAEMTGLVSVHNGMQAGFFGTTLCLCEPGYPHAWPLKYRIQLDEDIVAIGNFGTSIIVTTKGRPWLLQGTTPSTMSKVRMDYVLPCTSKQSLVNMGYGVCWASIGGLAMYSAQTGGDFVTKYVHSWDSWQADIDPATVVGEFYNGQYFGAHSTGAFVFMRDEQVGGILTEVNKEITSAYYSIRDGKLYYTYVPPGETLANVYLWDDPTQELETMDWMSKTIVAKDYINYGAARVIADYGSNPNDAVIAAQNAAQLALNQGYVANDDTKGPWARMAFGAHPVAGSQLKSMRPVGAGITFQLYVDKALVFTTSLADNGVFRLPSGYRADTVEVRVSGNARVRAIHMAETPLGLKNA